MGRLSNGRAWMDSDIFKGWLLVAASTTSSVVISEGPVPSHAVRERLARLVLVGPEIVLDRLVNLVGTDPDITANPPTFDEAAETLVQNKVNDRWTELATLMDPPS